MPGQHAGLIPEEAERVVQQLVAKHGVKLDLAARETLTTVLRSTCERLAEKVQICNAAELSRVTSNMGAASLPPVVTDEGLCRLRAQVQEAHADVLERRRVIPDCIRKDMHRLLENARPPMTLLPGAYVEGRSSDVAQLHPAPPQLHAQLAAVLLNFPELRARLSEMVGRLERVTAAVSSAAEIAAALPSPKQRKQEIGAKRSAVSPAFEEALRSGKIATRRRLRDRLSDIAPRSLAAQIAAQ